jgi:integrase
MRLTDISVRTLKAPEKGAAIYTDDILPGFGVRVSQAGTKSYVLTHGARRQRETIGRVGIITLQAAREDAKRRLAEYTLGKKTVRSIPWSAAVREYMTEVEARCRPSTTSDYRYILESRFWFGETKLCDVSPADLHSKLGKLTATPSFHRYSFVALRTFFRWAYQKHYIEVHPMDRMRSPRLTKARERVLTDDELRRVWIAADALGTFGSIVRVLILTGQRVGEISKLTYDMIGADTITLPSTLTKNGREHTFPVSGTARSLLPTCETNGSGYIFPARGAASTRPFSGFSASKDRLDAASGVPRWTLHDLRRTFASGLASLGVPLPVTEKLLNHVSGSFAGIVAVYQRYEYRPEMCAAVEKWDAHVQTLVAYGRQPRGIAMLPTWEYRDAALIEEASARNGPVLPSTYHPPRGGREVPQAGPTWPSTGRVGRGGSAGLAQSTDR